MKPTYPNDAELVDKAEAKVAVDHVKRHAKEQLHYHVEADVFVASVNSLVRPQPPPLVAKVVALWKVRHLEWKGTFYQHITCLREEGETFFRSLTD